MNLRRLWGWGRGMWIWLMGKVRMGCTLEKCGIGLLDDDQCSDGWARVDFHPSWMDG